MSLRIEDPGTASADDTTATQPSESRVRRWQLTSAVLALLLAAALLVLAGGWVRAADGGQVIRAGIAMDEWTVNVPSHALVAHTPLRFDVVNQGDLPHDLIISGVAGTPVLEPGEAYQLDVGSLTPGVYRIYCGIVGHDDLGMRAELTIIDEHARAHEDHDH